MTGADVPNATSLVAAARDETGLHDFGPESFVDALDVLVESMKHEARLTPDGLHEQLEQSKRSLVTHLRMQHYLDRYPEILAEPIVAPVVIVGPQRTGTSKLFRMIAADPQWNVLMTWQALNLVPFGGDRPDGHDPRVDFAEEWVREMSWLQPAHTLDARAPEMEALLLAGTFMLNAPTRIVPTHQKWCEDADYTDFYRHLRKMLQFLQWQVHAESGRRWILKSPPHLPNLRALVSVFPDATLVMTHRHPRTNVGSMLKLVELAQTRFAQTVDRDAIRDAWLRILTLNIERFLEFRDNGHDDDFVDIGYPEVTRDSMTAIARIYAAAGADFTDDTARNAHAWEAEHPQGEGGVFEYDLADYGLTDDDIAREFATYIARFGDRF
jgi:hypothetical protein